MTDLSTARSLERTAINAFSSRTQLLADPQAAQSLLHDMIVELEGWRRFIIVPTASVHCSKAGGEELAASDQQVLIGVLQALGFVRTEFAD